MSYSKVDIWNLALTNCGFASRIASETEGSAESELLASLHDHCVDYVLEDFPWRFAKKRATLALLSITAPTPWTYAYEKPQDCLKIRQIANPSFSNPLPSQRVPYERMTDGTYDIICTDMSEAELIYTARITDTTRFDPSFATALSFYMSTLIVIPLRGKPDIAQAMQMGYARSVREAAAKSMREGHFTENDGEFVRSRYA